MARTGHSSSMSTPVHHSAHHSTLYSVMKSTRTRRIVGPCHKWRWWAVTLRSVAADLADGRGACTCQLHSGHAACESEDSAPLRPPPRRIRLMQYIPQTWVHSLTSGVCMIPLWLVLGISDPGHLLQKAPDPSDHSAQSLPQPEPEFEYLGF